jgi:secretion/DNA translocation related CpaE-like protein
VTAATAPDTPRPLVVSGDATLLDDLLGLVAAAGAAPEVATGGPALRRAHRAAPLVLVGSDALATGVVRSLPRRPGVVVVSTGELPAADWAVAVELGAERVVVLPADEAWLLSRTAAAVRSPVERGRLIAVGGSCGGAGTSTVAAALALAAAPGAVLVDADPWAGGLDLLLGAERAEGLRWPELAGLRGRISGEALLAALPEVRGVHVVAASRTAAEDIPGEALLAVVEAGRSAGRCVVVDLPRPGGAPDAAVTTVTGDADRLLLVVPARLRAATAARLLLDRPGSAWAEAHVVLRAVPGGLARSDVAAVLGRPIAADLPFDRAAPARAERGDPPTVAARSPLGRLARRVLDGLPSR